MRAYKFLRQDSRSGYGDEPAWSVGEERTIDDKLKLCQRGYHSSPSWYDALRYAPGPVAAVVDISQPVNADGNKQVSRTLRMIALRNVEHEIRLWVIDCVERIVAKSNSYRYGGDQRSRQALAVARAFVAGTATRAELASAVAAACEALEYSAFYAGAAAHVAVADLEYVAAAAADLVTCVVVYDLGSVAGELAWQRQRLSEILDAALAS